LVLIADKRLTALSPILSSLADDVEIFAAAQGVMDAIAGFHIHRGILAFAERAPPVSAADLLSGIDGPAVVLGLFGISNHDNIGGVFRNAAAFGARAVLLDGACCDPLYRKAIRVSVGGTLIVPFARLASKEDALELLELHRFVPLALTPAGTQTLAKSGAPGRAAILLGAEGAGLPPAVLARAPAIAIPMAERFDSLNVATTSGIVLHHLASYGRAAG
jgi:tRNA G18 (ribose-2'-O)-methylase SpoU